MQERLAQLADRTTARLRARQFKAGKDKHQGAPARLRDGQAAAARPSTTSRRRSIAQVAADLLETWLAEQSVAHAPAQAVSDFEPETQLDLFSTPEFSEARQLDDALDRIHGRFGEHVAIQGTDR